ncbi:MAG TPA: Fic family protein [bacterium]|nr:Fic family protein [bacterium]
MNKQIQQIIAKKEKLDSFQPLPKALVDNLHNYLEIELTYSSNALEGNTLTRAETALVVEKGITVNGKTLREHLEAVNHAETFNWISQFADKKINSINESLILKLHRHILSKIDNENAGKYRDIAVRIAGSRVIMPNPAKVPTLMADFIAWLPKATLHPVELAIEAHLRFVSIHPFVDGNGRTGRLLMNLILMQAGYPPAIIRAEDRRVYINAIEKAQLSRDTKKYTAFMLDSIDRSLDVYLDAIDPKNSHTTTIEPQKLLKIGQLATSTGETVPTIRYWTQLGLLDVADQTKGGYQLYSTDMIRKATKIRKLQREKRLTLEEIKKLLQ